MDLFCKIFVDVNLKKESLVKLVAEMLQGITDQWCIQTETCLIGIAENDEFDAVKGLDELDGFLFSRFYFEIEANTDDINSYISQIGVLLEGLWKAGYKAVASCDFEELLPNKGGYNPSMR